MGADFICSIAALPTTFDGRPVEDLNVLQSRITKDVIDKFRWVFDETQPWIVIPDQFATDFENQTASDHMVATVLTDIINTVCGCDEQNFIVDSMIENSYISSWFNFRNCTEIRPKGMRYLLSGGVSWGDNPTDEMAAISILDELALFDEMFPNTCLNQPITSSSTQKYAIPAALHELGAIEALLDNETALDQLGIMEVQNRVNVARSKLTTE